MSLFRNLLLTTLVLTLPILAQIRHLGHSPVWLKSNFSLRKPKALSNRLAPKLKGSLNLKDAIYEPKGAASSVAGSAN